MDVKEFLAKVGTERSTPRELVARRNEAKQAYEDAKRRLERHEAATTAALALRRGRYAGFMSNVDDRWLFVLSYASSDDGHGRRKLDALECLVVPEVICDQTLHRPRPHDDPAKAAAGVVTMTPTPVPGDEVAAEIAGLYGANVRLGTFDEVLREPCTRCGAQALVICDHGSDFDSECQWVSVRRLCLACPLVEEIAGLGFDTKEKCTLLPPR